MLSLVIGPTCGGGISCFHTHLDAFLLVLALQAGYLLAIRRGTARNPQHQVSRRQIIFYTSGVAVLFLGSGTFIHDLSEQYLFSVHMSQHTLFTLVGPPLMLLGIPDWLLRPLISKRIGLGIGKFLSNPLVAFSIFNTITLITHLPVAVDFSLRHHNVHFVIHMVLVASSALMWWPVLSPLRELPRISPPFQMGYLFIQSLVPTVLTAFIIFAGTPLYEVYRDAPRIWGTTAVTDQALAGAIMKLVGGAILWVAIGIIFFRWYGKEEDKAIGRLQWEDVEHQLDEMGLTPKSP